MNKVYKIFWGGPAFGDNLLAAWVVNILNFNNIPSVLCPSPQIKKLVNSRIFNEKDSTCNFVPTRLNRTKRKDPNFTILTDLLDFFISRSNEKISLSNIDIKNTPCPIIYKDTPEIKGVDVVMVTKTGPWTPYRNWPYFDGLKKLLARNNISYIDLSEEKVKNFEFLNYVKKSKIYLGLETGASHYAAPFIDGKGFIIQSGYCSFDYWATHYNYIKIENKMHCAPCWKLNDCDYNHECMTQISPEKVLKKIQKNL